MKIARQFFLITYLTLLTNITFAQSVFSGTTGSIPDFPADTCFQLSLTNIFPAYIDTTFGLQKVCLNIKHPSPQDLNITLIAPNKSSVLLSGQNGNGEEWEGVCFTMDALSSIETANEFFDVEFLPENSIGELNNGQLAAGLWQLCVADLIEDNVGSIESWQLYFNFEAPDPVNEVLKDVCTTNTTYGCLCPDDGDNCFLLPDLVIAEALTLENFKEITGAIKFNTAISNIGYGPLEFYTSNQWYCGDTLLPNLTMCENGEWPKQLVKQRVYRKFPNQNAGFVDFDAGLMSYQSNQNLNNLPQITSWAENTIRIKGASENPLKWPVIVSAGKTALCIENTLQCTTSNMVCVLDNVVGSIENLPNSRLGQNYACNSPKAGIAVGYANFDGQNIEGQEIQFSAATCNGTYYLVTQFDSDSTILELDEFNNVSAVEFQLTQQVDNCCTANFSTTQLEMNGSFINFKDLTVPIPNSWFWNFGDGTSSNTQFPTHQYDKPGEYTIELTIENELGCSSFISKSIMVKDVEVSNQSFINNAAVEVNTLANEAIQIILSSTKILNINLLSINGSLIQKLSTNERLSKGQHIKKLPKLSAGIYLIQVNIEGISLHKEIIIF